MGKGRVKPKGITKEKIRAEAKAGETAIPGNTDKEPDGPRMCCWCDEEISAEDVHWDSWCGQAGSSCRVQQMHDG